ncbi:hypothetical protein GGI17_003201 [Coemansia sp. S146]|nr:hypothetical protein GGI17_003201 [Coemansia sp. S146]
MLDRVLPLDVLGMIFVLAQWPSLARVSRAFYAASQSAGVRARYCLAEFGRGRVLDGALGLPARRPRMTRPDVVLLLLRLGADPRADDQWVLRHACDCAGPWTPIVRTVLHMRHQGPGRIPTDLDPVSGWRGIGNTDVTSPGPLLIDVHDGDDLALRIAAGRGHTAIVNILLDAGADAEALRGEPLALAAANAHADTVRALLGRGADAGAEHSRALRSAVLCGDANTDSVTALLDAGACVHAVDDSCLLAASYAGDGSALAPGSPPPDASRAALLAYATTNLPMHPPRPAPAAASFVRRYGRPTPRLPATHVRLVQLLIERGADPNACQGRPLAYACARGSVRTAAVLLAHNADPRARDDEPLRDAAERGHVDVMRLLLRAGARVHADNDTPLVNAARGGHIAAVHLLLAHGADASSPAGVRALCAAARGGWPALVLVLIAAGADSTNPEFIACAQRSRPVRAALQIMLSVEPIASIEAAVQPPAASDEHSWLPDFDSPGITIALPPLAYSGSQSLDDCLMHPSLAKPDAVGPADTVLRPHSLAENPVCNASPAVAVTALPTQSPAIDPLALSLDLPNILAGPKNSTDAAATTGTTLLDRLGLNFDFHTDPAIDAISDSPLYLSFASHELITGLRDDTPAVDEEPPALHLPSLPESPLGPASSASPLSLESESCSNKSSTRRTSIAGMLKKRLSKCSDANGDIASTTISPSPSTTDANDVVVVVVATDIQPTLEVQPFEPELSHNSDDATCDSQVSPSNEPVVEPPVVATVAFVADVANPEPTAHPESQRKGESVPVAAPPSNDAGEERNVITAPSVDTPTQAPSDVPPLPPLEADPVASAPAPETPTRQGDDAEVVDSQPPPPPRRPSIHRHLDRRSSRILEGLTRKVQHVRQTTSMVLRRSVGSHLSFRPATPPDVFQGSIVGLAGLRGCGVNDGELEQEHLPQSDGGLEKQAHPPPQYSASNAEPSNTNAENSCTSASSAGGEANPASAEDPSHANGHINELGDKLVDVSATRSTTALNATSDKFHASNHMDTFSRKLSSVRHGTNVAVRNSVTRVKNIFAAKRSVAA